MRAGKFPYIGTTRGLIDGKHWLAMGVARGFYDYLVDRQTHPDGRVNYGNPITYRRMTQEIPNCPDVRTLQRWMKILRDGKYITVKNKKYEGMKISITKPKKWAAQSSLGFGDEGDGETIAETVAAPKADLQDSSVHVSVGTSTTSKLSGLVRQKVAGKTLKNKSSAMETDTPSANGALAKTQWLESSPSGTASVSSEAPLAGRRSEGSSHPLFEAWQQEHGSMPAAQELTSDRLGRCRVRVKTHAGSEPSLRRFLADFREAVKKAAQTPFLTGQGERGWMATFDWFIANDTNWRKVLEGSYDAPIPIPKPPERGVGVGPKAADYGVRVRPEVLERERKRREKYG